MYKFIFKYSSICCFLFCGFLTTGLSAQTYAIISKSSGMALDVPGSSQQQGAKVIQWQYKGSENQHFKFESLGHDAYIIRAAHSNKALTAPIGGKNNLYQADYNGSGYQGFTIEPAGDGYFFIYNKATQKYVDVANNSKKAGTDIYLWGKHGGANQIFQLKEIGNSSVFYCERGKNESNQTFQFRVTNKSMWIVRFRVKAEGAWTGWNYANVSLNGPQKVAVPFNGSIEEFKIQWKDLTTWKNFNRTPLKVPNQDMNITVSGNTFSGIKLN